MNTRRPSLRSHFAWTFAGNVVHGASQWAVLSLIAKLGSTEMLGEYALGLAIATPVAMLAHLNLRAVLATDVAHRHVFGDYFVVRAGANLVALLGLAVMAAVSSQAPAVIFLIGASLIAENFSDLYYGWMQRQERLHRVSQSMILRALVSISAAGVGIVFFRSAAAAAAGVLAGRVITLLAFDLPLSGARWSKPESTGPVLRAAIPLGFVLMLSSLTANIPRYAIERASGIRELGIFAAVASFVSLGSTVVNALGQSATTRMATHFEAGERRAFRHLAWQLAGMAIGLGIAGAAIAAVAGPFFLRVLYRPEFAHYNDVLVAVLAAGTLSYVAGVLGYVITSTRTFTAQMPLLAMVSLACAAVSFMAVPAFGLMGAALAIGAAGGVQVVGQIYLLRRAL